MILRCGYHGWHDWCVEVHGGVPEAVRDLTDEFEYGNLADLEAKLTETGDVACIIITPVGHPLAKPDHAAAGGYLQGGRALPTRYDSRSSSTRSARASAPPWAGRRSGMASCPT